MVEKTFRATQKMHLEPLKCNHKKRFEKILKNKRVMGNTVKIFEIFGKLFFTFLTKIKSNQTFRDALLPHDNFRNDTSD